MKKIVSIIISITVLLSFAGCKKEEKTMSNEVAQTNVTVTTAQKKSISDIAVYTGEVVASDSAKISAKISGNAKSVNVEVGDYVSEGDVLVVIDDTDYKTQYNQARAMYNQALAQYNSIVNGSSKQTKLQLETALNSAKIEYNNAKTNYENQKVLYESGAISRIAYDSAVTRYENAKINYESAQKNHDLTLNIVLEESKASAKAALESASVQMESAQNLLNNTIVRAPISGYIASRNANKGQMVAQGMEIFSIKSTDMVNVKINVTESVIPYIKVGAKAKITVKAAENKEVEGEVTAVSTVKDAATFMYGVSISIENFDNSLKDGMLADAEITLSESQDALVIPSEAVMEDEKGAKYVYIAQENTAVRKNVTLGIVTDEYSEVKSGILEGDKVIVSGKEYITEKNNAIKIVK